jgi:anaerobic selenocysteine-containing dehydrogenase
MPSVRDDCPVAAAEADGPQVAGEGDAGATGNGGDRLRADGPASEYNLRLAGEWDESKQTVTTICPYYGVGCNLELRVQDNRIVKVTSPLDHDVSYGHRRLLRGRQLVDPADVARSARALVLGPAI